jgi:hypothetical protein
MHGGQQLIIQSNITRLQPLLPWPQAEAKQVAASKELAALRLQVAELQVSCPPIVNTQISPEATFLRMALPGSTQ